MYRWLFLVFNLCTILGFSDEIPSYMDYGGKEFKTAFLSTMFWLIVLIATAVVVLWSIKRIGQNKFNAFKSNGYAKVLERKQISPKTTLYLIEFGQKQILVSESSLEIDVISTSSIASMENIDKS